MWQKILNKLSRLENYVRTWKFLLLGLGLLLVDQTIRHFDSSIGQLLIINEKTISQLIPFIVICLFIGIVFNKKTSFDTGSFLAFMALTLALFTLLAQYDNDYISRLQSIEVATRVNCLLSQSIMSGSLSPDEAQSYSIDLYTQNYGFLLDLLNQNGGDPSVAYRGTIDIGQGNRLLNLIQQTNVADPIRQNYQNLLIENAGVINSVICSATSTSSLQYAINQKNNLIFQASISGSLNKILKDNFGF